MSIFQQRQQAAKTHTSTRSKSDLQAGLEIKDMDAGRTVGAPPPRADWTIAECLALLGITSKTPRKRATLRAALLARARNEMGVHATALDFVCRQVAAGVIVRDMAAAIAVDMGESCSRSFLSLIVHRLAPDATERIAAARRAHSLANDNNFSRGNQTDLSAKVPRYLKFAVPHPLP